MRDVMRWMRQQRKKVLVAITVVIMVSFTLGSALYRLFEPSRIKDGELFGHKVKGGEIARYLRPLSVMLPGAAKEGQLRGLAWETLMMLHEARLMGIEASEAEVADWVRMRFGDQEGHLHEHAYRDHLAYAGLAPRDFEGVLADWITREKVLHAVQTAVSMSGEEAWRWYCRENTQAKVRYALVEARDLEPAVNVTDEEIAKQYEAGKNLLPQEAPNGAGYKLPERIKIEYILVPFEPVEKLAVITQRQIEKQYEANRESYRVPPKDKDDKSPPAYRPLAEVEKQIESDLRREEARRVGGEIRDAIAREVEREMDAPFGSTDERVADMQKIAKGKAVEYAATDWFGADDIGKTLPGALRLRQQAFGQGMGVINSPRSDIECSRGLLIYQVKDVKLPMPAALEDVRDRVIKDARGRLALDLSRRIASESALSDQPFDEVVKEIEKRVTDHAAKAPPAPPKPEGAATDAGKDPAAAAKKSLVQTGETGFFRRPSSFRDPQTGETRHFAFDMGMPAGNPTSVAVEAFRLKPGGVGVACEAQGGKPGTYVIELVSFKRPERAEFDKQADQHLRRLVTEKQRAAFLAWRTDLLRRAKPSRNALEALYSLGYWGMEAE